MEINKNRDSMSLRFLPDRWNLSPSIFIAKWITFRINFLVHECISSGNERWDDRDKNVLGINIARIYLHNAEKRIFKSSKEIWTQSCEVLMCAFLISIPPGQGRDMFINYFTLFDRLYSRGKKVYSEDLRKKCNVSLNKVK